MEKNKNKITVANQGVEKFKLKLLTYLLLGAKAVDIRVEGEK